jgi:hypothetical protein
MLGVRFCPRLRDFPHRKLASIEPAPTYRFIQPLFGRRIRADAIREHWDEVLRLVASLKAGTVLASAMLIPSQPLHDGDAKGQRYAKRHHSATLFALWPERSLLICVTDISRGSRKLQSLRDDREPDAGGKVTTLILRRHWVQIVIIVVALSLAVVLQNWGTQLAVVASHGSFRPFATFAPDFGNT